MGVTARFFYLARAGRPIGARIRGGVAMRGIGRGTVPIGGLGRAAVPIGGRGRGKVAMGGTGRGAVPIGGTGFAGRSGRVGLSGRPYM